jgi:hypothetical protein
MHCRILLAAAVALMPALAMADESIAGQWQADLGHGALISMDVLADGYWTSQTIEKNKVVATMAGTYRQTKQNPTSGTLVFTPTPSKSKASRQHGAPQVETDRYTLQNDGSVLRLVTRNEGSSAAGDTMVFHRQPPAKG